MKPEDISNHIDNLQSRTAELERLLADPAVYSDPANCRKISLEHRKLLDLFANFRRWEKILGDFEENNRIINSSDDEELKELAAAEQDELQAEAQKLESKIRLALLPPDPNDERNIIVEIKPAAGGDEAALFAGDMLRMYMHYAESRNWKLEMLDQTPSELGGIKNASFSIAGDGVFSRMKFESGVHRVQRVPETESGGRIHTSTITVSVMPEAEEVELDVRQEDLRFDVFRSSGPGGQCVNTTDSAVRVTHIPSGLSVASQQEKSQHRNKEIALRILYARLLEHKQEQEAAKFAADRRSQVGTGDRSERIRTYNYPQNRVTDHRFNVSTFDLPKLMEGDLDLILEPILLEVSERALENLHKN